MAEFAFVFGVCPVCGQDAGGWYRVNTMPPTLRVYPCGHAVQSLHSDAPDRFTFDPLPAASDPDTRR